MNEAIVRIYFKGGKFMEKGCVDIKLDNGFLIIIYKQFSDDLEDPIIEAFANDEIQSFEFVRMKGEENEESLSEEHEH